MGMDVGITEAAAPFPREIMAATDVAGGRGVAGSLILQRPVRLMLRLTKARSWK
jgi:hypothetical protein